MTLKTCYFDERLRKRCSATGFQSGSLHSISVSARPATLNGATIEGFPGSPALAPRAESVRPYVRAVPDTSTPFLPEGYNT